MEVLGALIGVGVIAISPLVPGLRPVAKTAIKGGMAVVDMSKGAAAVAVHQWGQVVAEASAKAEEIEQTDSGPGAAESVAATSEALAAEAPATSAERILSADAAEVESIEITQESAVEVSGEVVAEEMSADPIEVAADDFKLIDGIGPKVESVLHSAGITTFEQIADSDPDQIRQILTDAGSRYRVINPDGWPDQARALAASPTSV